MVGPTRALAPKPVPVELPTANPTPAPEAVPTTMGTAEAAGAAATGLAADDDDEPDAAPHDGAGIEATTPATPKPPVARLAPAPVLLLALGLPDQEAVATAAAGRAVEAPALSARAVLSTCRLKPTAGVAED
jgi:hypothetical protein